MKFAHPVTAVATERHDPEKAKQKAAALASLPKCKTIGRTRVRAHIASTQASSWFRGVLMSMSMSTTILPYSWYEYNNFAVLMIWVQNSWYEYGWFCTMIMSIYSYHEYFRLLWVDSWVPWIHDFDKYRHNDQNRESYWVVGDFAHYFWWSILLTPTHKETSATLNHTYIPLWISLEDSARAPARPPSGRHWFVSGANFTGFKIQ